MTYSFKVLIIITEEMVVSFCDVVEKLGRIASTRSGSLICPMYPVDSNEGSGDESLPFHARNQRNRELLHCSPVCAGGNGHIQVLTAVYPRGLQSRGEGRLHSR